jgi:DNA-binding response OmpR family regulator
MTAHIEKEPVWHSLCSGSEETPIIAKGISDDVNTSKDLLDTRILLIDDDQWIRNSMTLYFEAEGCHVQSFATAEEGITACQDDMWDVIIIDYHLPGMDGLTMLDNLRGCREGIIKILITAYTSDTAISRARDVGVNAFIEKPFTADEIEATLVKLLRERRA